MAYIDEAQIEIVTVDYFRELGTECSLSLAGLRDTLLPKLLSGEIELPEGEVLIEGGT